MEAQGSEIQSEVTAIRLLVLAGRKLNEIRTLPWEDEGLEAAEPRLCDSKSGARMVPVFRNTATFPSTDPRTIDSPGAIIGERRASSAFLLHQFGTGDSFTMRSTCGGLPYSLGPE